jgi:hypothetical protein
VLCHLTGAHIVADPVTGNFLVHGNYNGSFYEFNPDGNGTWTNLNTGGSQYGTGVTQLPTTVSWDTTGNSGPGGNVVTSLYEHGVVCYLSGVTGAQYMHLYKHG